MSVSMLVTRNLLLAGALGAALLGCTDKADDTEPDGNANNSPVANGGPDLEVSADDQIVLDASGSYDPDGDALTFHWTLDRVPEGSTLTGDGAFPGNHTAATSTELRPDIAGTYIASLVVEDARGASSDSDSVVITVSPGDLPVASAGADQDAVVGATVTMDGSSSYDPLGRSLTYTWELASAPANSSLSALENPENVTTTFVPDVGGRYVLSLMVNNGLSDSAPDIAYVDVSSSKPEAPVADAGEDITDAMDCSNVALDGSGSFDPNGDILSYEWTLQSKPDGSSASNSDIADRNAEVTGFYPDIAGDYQLSLAVKDNDGWSAPDLLDVAVSERNFNTAPDVDAGPDQNIDGGTASCESEGYTYDCDSCPAVNVQLGVGAVVTDADGDQVSIGWSTVGETQASVLAPTELVTTAQLSGATPVEPGACTETEFSFQVDAVDCPGAVGSDTVTITVTCCGVNPPDSGS